MVKRTLIFLFVLSIISIALHSCRWSRRFETFYEWVDFDVSRPVRLHSSRHNHFYWREGEIIPKNDLAFRITMIGKVLDRRRLAQLVNFNVITEAMALTLPAELYNRSNTITAITVRTIYDYSDVFQAGADITSLFKAGFRYPEMKTIEEFISFLKEDRKVEWRRTLDTRFHIFLMDDTSIGGKQRFEITITLDDSTVLVRETEDLMLE